MCIFSLLCSWDDVDVPHSVLNTLLVQGSSKDTAKTIILGYAGVKYGTVSAYGHSARLLVREVGETPAVLRET